MLGIVPSKSGGSEVEKWGRQLNSRISTRAESTRIGGNAVKERKKGAIES